MNEERIFSVIVEVIREILSGLPDRELRPDDTLDALGANSMDRAEIMMTVLERIDLNIPLVETFGPKNIGELAGLLSRKKA